MPFFVVILIIVLALIGVIAWGLSEINRDRKWQASRKPTVPAPLERMPPRIDL
jgi:flagellar biogenesis protein FliO